MVVSNIFYVHPEKIGEDSQFDEYFSKGLVQPPTSILSSSPQKRSVASWIQVLNRLFGSSSPAPGENVLDVPDGRWDGIGSRLMNEAKCTKIMLHLQHHLGGGFKHFLFSSLPEEDSHLA